MSDILALDIETANYSWQIGGWGNTHMFRVSTVCTWDGDKGTVYIDKSLDEFNMPNTIVKSMSELKFDLDDAIEYYIMLTRELRSALASGDEDERARLLGEKVVV